MNPVILLAVVVQSVVSRQSRVAGAIVGFVITTGVLLWGLSVYAEGNQIQFFAVPLSQGAFFLSCAVWFFIDARALRAARRTGDAALAARQPYLIDSCDVRTSRSGASDDRLQ